MPSRWYTPVSALVVTLTACTTNPATPIATASMASPTPTAVGIDGVALEGLELEEPDWKPSGSNWTLVLTWDAPVGVTVDHYEVRRNAITVEDVVDSTSYRDDDVEPGTRYRYEVTGVDAEGGETAAAKATIKTRELPLADARLEGTFAMRLTVDRATGTRNPVRGGAISFAFDPRCGWGPCEVHWTVSRARAEGRLDRDGAVYTASVRTPLFVRSCFGDVIDEMVDVRLRVTRAAPIRDEWRATKIEGTIGEVSSYGGCMTATVDWDVRGTLQS